MANNVKLEEKAVGDIRGVFNVPSYQRGYRWGKQQVKMLLEDLYVASVKKMSKYCLQPVVVLKTSEGHYDLIDGQQRLTSILILLNYIRKFFPYYVLNFSLEYETRKDTARFLESMDESLADSNIDFFHIFQANNTIKEWLEEKFRDDTNRQYNALTSLNTYLTDSVKVIWYEVGEDTDPIALFTRLNIGKIQLTNAELIRALFLSSSGDEDDKRKQLEMSIQWDNIEKQLRSDNDEFWAFITRKDPAMYPTRIEILFDLMTGKQETEIDKFYTFFEMEKMICSSSNKKDDVWQKVLNSYLQIKDWYENKTLYHKIGYLIASSYKTMNDIFFEAQNKRKREFSERLDELITESITFKSKARDDYWELDYTKDYDKISKLLLLFNVASIKDGMYQHFPFSKYNSSEWSLEHIHAQHSEGLKTRESQVEWLRMHLRSLKAISDDGQNEELIDEMEEFIKLGNFDRSKFEDVFVKVVNLLSEGSDTEYIHSLSNMALLKRSDNSALNNSTFDVKRNLIVNMDKEGKFIPYCTKMVFLKYYTDSEDNQVHFWGKKDRDAYLKAIKDVLDVYVNKIKFENE